MEFRNNQLYDDRGNPVLDHDQSLKYVGEQIAAGAKWPSIKFDPNTPDSDIYQPGSNSIKYRVNVFDVMEKGVPLEALPKVMTKEDSLFIPSEEEAYAKYGSKFKTQDEFDLYYAKLSDTVSAINDMSRDTVFHQSYPSMLEMGGYKPFTSGPMFQVRDTPLKYGAGVDGNAVLFSDEQLASMSGNHYVFDPVSDGWMEKETTWYDKLSKNIILQRDKDGNPFWQEAPYSSLYGPGQVMSIWGPRRPYANPLWGYPVKFASAATTELAAAATKLTGLAQYGVLRLLGISEDEIMDNKRERFGDDASPMDWPFFDPKVAWGLSNWLDKFTYKQTEKAEITPWQDLMLPWKKNNNFGDFAMFLTEMVGMLTPQRAIPWAISKAGKRAAVRMAPAIAEKMTKGLAVEAPAHLAKKVGIKYAAGAFNGVEKKVIDKVALDFAMRMTMPTSFTMRSISMGIGTTQALAGDWINTAHTEGIPMDDIVKTAIYAMPAVMATEWFLSSKYLTRGLGMRPNNDVIQKNLKEIIGGLVKQYGKESTGKPFFRSLFTKQFAKSLLKKDSWMWTTPVLRGAVYEGLQEGSEEVWYETLRLFYNKNVLPGVRDAELGLWEDREGFSTYLGSEGWANRIAANAVGGAWGGGLFDGMIGITQKRVKEEYIRQNVYTNQIENLHKQVAKAYHSDLGGKHIGLDGKPLTGEPTSTGIKPNENGDFDQYGVPRDWEINTMHDQMIWQTVQEIEMVKVQAEKAGFTDPRVQDMFGKSLYLAELAVDQAKKITEVENALQAAKKKLTPELTPEQKTLVETEIAETQKKVDQEWENMNRITKPLPGQKYSQTFNDVYLDRAIIFALDKGQNWGWGIGNVVTAREALNSAKNDLIKRREQRQAAGATISKIFEETTDELKDPYEANIKGVMVAIEEMMATLDADTTIDSAVMSDVAITRLNKMSEALTAHLQGLVSQTEHVIPQPGGSFSELFQDEDNKDMAFEGLKNVITILNQRISNPDITEEERASLQAQLVKAQENATRGFEIEYVDKIQQKVSDFNQRKYSEMPLETFVADNFKDPTSIDPKGVNPFISIEEHIKQMNLTLDALDSEKNVSDLFSILKIIEIRTNQFEAFRIAQKVDSSMGYNISGITEKFTEEQIDNSVNHLKKLKDGWVEGKKNIVGAQEMYDKTLQKSKERGVRELRKKAIPLLKHETHIISEVATFSSEFSKELTNDAHKLQNEFKEALSKETDTEKMTWEQVHAFNVQLSDIKARMFIELKTVEKRQQFVKDYSVNLLSYMGKHWTSDDAMPAYTYSYGSVFMTMEKYLESDPSDFVGNLTEFVRDEKTQVSTAKKKAYVNLYYVQRMNMINEMMMMNSQDLDLLFKDSFELLGYSPSVEQQKAMRLLVAFENSPMPFFAHTFVVNNWLGDNARWEKLKSTNKFHAAKINGKDVNYVEGFNLKNTMILQAIGGAGKTTVMSNLLFSMLEIRAQQIGKRKSILVVAPNQTISNKIKAQVHPTKVTNIDITTITYNDFRANYAEKSKAYDLVIIDEGSRISLPETFTMSESGPASKMIIMLDPLQATNTNPDIRSEFLPILDFAPSTSSIDEVFRTGNYDIWIMQKMLADFITNMGVTEVKFKQVYRHNIEKSAGIMYYRDLSSLMAAFKESMNGILVVRHAKDKENLKESLTAAQFRRVRYINDYGQEGLFAEGTIQGSEEGKVFVAFDMSLTGDKSVDIPKVRDFRTAVGRSINFLGIINNDPGAVEAIVFDSELNPNPEVMPDEQKKRIRLQAYQMASKLEYSDEFKQTFKPKTEEVIAEQKAEQKKKTEAPKAEPKAKETTKTSAWEHRRVKGIYKRGDTVILKPGNENYPFSPTDVLTIDNVYQKKNKRLYVSLIDSDGQNYEVPLMHIESMFEVFVSEEPIQQEQVPIVDTEEVPTDGNEQIDIWANRFHEGNNEVFPFSLMTDVTTEGTTLANYRQEMIRKKRAMLLGTETEGPAFRSNESLQLVFYKEVVLYSSDKANYTSLTGKKHYNVILVKTNSGKVLGSLFQPIPNQKAWDDYKKGKRTSTTNRESYPQIEWEAGSKRYAYMNALRKLYDKGIRGEGTVASDGGIVIGNMRSVTFTGGLVDSVQSERWLFKDLVAKLGPQATWKLNNDGEIEIKQMRNSDGRVNLYAFVSYTPENENWVPIEVHGAKYSEIQNKDIITNFNQAVADLRAKILKEGREGNMLAILNASHLKSTINFNRAMIVKKGQLTPKLRGILRITDNGKLDFVFRKDQQFDKELLLKNMEEARLWILDNGFFNMEAKRGETKNNVIIQSDNVRDILGADLYTPVKDVSIMQAKGFVSTGNPSSKTSRHNIAFLTKEMAANDPPQDHDGGNEYLSETFGSSMLRGHLQIKPSVYFNGKQVWGYVHKFQMIVEGMNGDFSKAIAQHEAVHFALKYFISPKSRINVLNAVKEQVLREKGEVLDYDTAEEYLSEVNRGVRDLKQEYKGITGLIKEFVNWFSELVFNVKVFGNAAHKFLYKLNHGYFKNAKIRFNNYDHVAMMNMFPMSELLSENSNISIEELHEIGLVPGNVIEGTVSRAELVKVFGTEFAVNRAIAFVRRNGWEFSSLNRKLDNFIGDPRQGVQNWKNDIEAIRNGGKFESSAYSYDPIFESVNSYESFASKYSENQFGTYAVTKILSNPAILDTLVKYAYPELLNGDTEEVNRKRKYSKNEVVTKSDDHASRFVYSFFDTIPLVSYKSEEGILQPTEDQEEGNFIDFEKLRKALYSLNIGTDIVDPSNPFNTRAENFLKKVYHEASVAALNGDSDMANTLMSFYRVMVGNHKQLNMFSETGIGDVSGDVEYSYRDLVMFPKDVLRNNGVDEEGLRLRLTDPNTKAKLKDAASLYTAVMSLAISYATIETAHLEEGKKSDLFYNVVSHNTGFGQLRESFKEAIKTRMYPDNVYKKNFFQKHGKDGKVIRVFTNDQGVTGMYYGQRENPILVINPTKKQWEINQYWKEGKLSDITRMLKDAASEIGLYLDWKTVNFIVHTKGTYNVDSFARFIGDAYSMAFTSIYHDVGVEILDIKRQSGTVGADLEYINDNFNNIHKTVFEAQKQVLSLADRLEEGTLSGEPGYNYAISDFFDDLVEIAKIEAAVQFISHKGFNRNAAGETITPNIVLSNLYRNYPFGETASETSKHIRENVRKFLQSLPEEERNAHLLSKDPVYTGRMMIRIALETGMRNDFMGIDQKSYTPKDYWNAVISHFHNSLSKKRQAQEFIIYPDTYGDSSTHLQAIVTLSSDRSNQPFIIPEGDISKITLNDKLFNDYFNEELQQEYLIYQQSLNRWSNAIVAFGPDKGKPLLILSKSIRKLIAQPIRTMSEDKMISEALEKAMKKLGTSPVSLQLIQGSNLIENRDYFIQPATGSIIPGNATNFGGRGQTQMFSIEFFHKWNTAVEADKRILRKQYFSKRYFALNQTMNEFETIKVEGLSKRFYMDEMEEGTEMKKWNPFFEGLMYIHHFTSRHFQTYNVGLPHQFGSISNYGKYAKAAAVSGIAPVINTPYGLTDRSNWIKLKDVKKAWPGLSNLLGIDQNATITDGQRIMNPIQWMMYAYSLGGDYGVVKTTDVGAKSVNAYIEPTENTGHFIKSATFVMNEDQFNNNRTVFNTLMRYFLAPVQGNVTYRASNGEVLSTTLVELYNTLESQGNPLSSIITTLHESIAAEKIAGNKRFGEEMIAGIMFSSTDKIPSGRMNQFDYDVLMEKIELGQTEDVITSSISNTNELVQNNPIYNEHDVAKAQQLSKQMFAMDHNHDRAREIESIDAAQTRKAEEQLVREIDELGYDRFAKRYASQLVRNMRSATFLSEIIHNENIAMSFPNIHGMLAPAITAAFEKGIAYRTTGTELLQVHDVGMYAFKTIYRQVVNKDGVRELEYIYGVTDQDIRSGYYSDYEILTDANGKAITTGLQRARLEDANGVDLVEMADNDPVLTALHQRIKSIEKQLKILSISDPNQIDIVTVEDLNQELRDKRNEKTALIQSYWSKVKTVRPQQVAMHFQYLNEFGISDFIRVNEQKTGKKIEPTLNHILNLKFEKDGATIIYNVRDFVKKNSKDYNTSKKDGLTKLAKILKQDFEYLSKDSFVAQLRDQLGWEFETAEDVVKYYNTLLQSLDLIILRKPTADWSNISAAEIGAINYHSEGMIVTSGFQMLLDGSDNDGDHLNILYRAVTTNKNGKPVISRPKSLGVDELMLSNNKQLDNARFDRYFETFTDPRSVPMLFNPVKHQDMIERGRQELSKQQTKTKFHFNDLATQEHLYRANKGSEGLIGYGATAINIYHVLMGISKTVWDKNVYAFTRYANGEKVVDGQREYIANILGTYLQTFLEDNKHGIVSSLGLNRASSPLILALAMSDMTLSEMMDFLKKEHVENIVKEAYSTMSINERTDDIWNIAGQHIDRINNANTAAVIIDRYNNLKAEIEKDIKALKDSLDDMVKNPIDLIQHQRDEAILSDISIEQLFKEVLNKPDLTEEQQVQVEDFIEDYEDIKDSIKLKEAWLKKYATENDYLEHIEGKNNKALEDITKLRGFAIQGEALHNLNIVIRMLRKLPSTDYDMYMTNENLKRIFRVNDVMAYLNDQDKQNFTGVIDKYIRHLEIPKKVTDQDNYLKNGTQEEVDNITKTMFEQLITVMGKKMDGVRVNLYSTGDSGFGQSIMELADAPSVASVNMVMPKGYRHKSMAGVDTYGENALRSLLGKKGNRAHINITEEPKGYYPDALSAMLKNDLDVVIIFEPFKNVETSVAESMAIAAGKKVVKIGNNRFNVVTGQEKSISRDAIYKQIRVAVDEALQKVVEESKGEKKKLNIAILGTNLYSMNRASEKTAYELELEREKAIDTVLNAGEIIKNNKRLSQVLRTFYTLYNLRTNNTIGMSPSAMSYVKEVAEHMRRPILNKNQFYAVQSELNRSIAHQVLLRMEGSNNIDIWHDEISLSHLKDQTYSNSVNMRTNEGINYYLLEFPHYIMNLKNNEYPDDIFFSTLVIRNGNLVVDQDLQLSKAEMDQRRRAFERLPLDLQKKFVFYDLAKYGFNNNKLRQFMGGQLIEETSDHFMDILKIDRRPLFRESFWNNMDENFVMNALISNDRLKTFQTKEMKEQGLNPLVITEKQRKTYNDGPHKNKTRTFINQKYIYRDDRYKKVYPIMSSRAGILDSRIPMWTDSADVIQLTDVDAARDFMHGHNALREYSFAHGYPHNFDAYVMGTYADVTSFGTTAVYVKRANEPIAESRVLSIQEANIKKEKALKFVNTLAKKLPWLRITAVNNETAVHKNRRAYIVKDGVHYNIDMITQDTPLHEIIHPLLLLAETTDNVDLKNFYDLVMGKVTEEIANDTNIVKAVHAAYPDLDGIAFQYEVAATLLGFNSVEKVKQYISVNPQSIYDSVKEWLQQAYDSIRDTLRRFFFGEGSEYKKMKISSLNAESTVKEISEAILEDIMANRFENSFTFDDVHAIEAMLIGSESRPLTRINNIMDLEKDLLFNGEDVTIAEKQAESNINYWYNELLDPRNDKIIEGVDFKPFWNTMTKDDIKEKIREEIISKRKGYLAEFDTNFELWLKQDEADLNKIGSRFGKYVAENYNELTFRKLKHWMYVNEASYVFKFSDMQNLQKYPELKAIYDPALDDGHTYVVIHAVTKDDSGKNVFDMSVINVNFESPFYYNPVYENRLISASYISDWEAKGLNIFMKNNLTALRNLHTGLIAMNALDVLGAKNVNFIGIKTIFREQNSKAIAIEPVNIGHLMQNIQGLSRINAFSDKLDGVIKKLFLSETLNKPYLYEPDYMNALMNFWENQRMVNEGLDEDKNTKLVNFRSETKMLLDMWIKDPTSFSTLLQAIRKHQQYIDDAKGLHKIEGLTLHEARALDPEARFLTMVAKELTDIISVQNKNTINVFNMMMSPTYNYAAPLLQNFFGNIHSTMNQISGLVMKETNELNQHIEKVNKQYFAKHGKLWSFFQDDANKRFDPLIIKTKFQGGMIIEKEFNDLEIHHDKTDPRTLKALNEGIIDEEMLSVGKFIVDKTEQHLKSIIRYEELAHKTESYIKDDGSIDQNKLDVVVDEKYNSNWKRGWLPIMAMKASEAFAQGKFRTAFDRFMVNTENPNAIFEEMLDFAKSREMSDSIGSMFLNQAEKANGQGEGMTNRDKALGLSIRTNGEKYVTKPEVNANITHNINTVMRYLIMDNISRPLIEQEILPLIDDAITTANLIRQTTGETQENIIRTIKLQSDKMVGGKHRKQLGFNDKTFDKAEGWVRMGLRVTSFSGVALSIPVFILSITSNTTEAVLEGVANEFYPGVNDLFTFTDLRKAATEYITNRSKMVAVTEKYQVMFADRWNILNDVVHDITQNHLWTQNFFHGPNRWTDIVARQIVASAVMIHDGTYDAHDSEGNYDAKKDSRLYASDGSRTEAQVELEKWLVQDLLNDKRYAEEQIGKNMPVVAYDSKDIERLKYAGNQFVIGVYDKIYTPGGDSYLAYDILMQFKKFITSKIQVRLGGRAYEEAGAKRVILTDEEGKPIKNKRGHIMRQRKALLREGTWATTAKDIRALAAKTPGLGDLLNSMKIVHKERNLQYWKQRTDLERRNLIRAALDVVTFAATYLLFNGLKGLAPDDEDLKKRAKYEARQLRVLRAAQRGINTIIATSPYQLIDMATSFALLSQARRVMNVIVLDEPWKNIKQMLPGASSVKSINETYEFFIPETK